MTNPRAQGLLDEAQQAYDDDNLEEASKLLTRAMRLDPDNARLYEVRAAIWNDAGSPQYAIPDASRALRLDPSSVPALIERGNALLATGRFGDAADDFSKALGLLPADERIDVQFARGRSMMLSRHWDAAIEDFTEVIRLSPDAAVAYNERGFAFEKAGRPAKALRDLNHAVDLEPKNPAFRLNRGSALFNMNRKAEAEADWELAYDLGKKDNGLVYQLEQRFKLLDKSLPGAKVRKPKAAAAPKATATPKAATAAKAPARGAGPAAETPQAATPKRRSRKKPDVSA